MSRRRSLIPSESQLRVGFVTPGLGVGGAERWVVTLAKHFSPAIKVSGVLSYCTSDPLSPEAGRICPLYGPHQARNLMEGSDVIIAWGWESLPTMFKNFRGRMIGVSHASPLQEWHVRVAKAMASFPGIELVGVSRRSLDVWTGGHTGVYIPNGAEVDRCTPREGRQRVRKKLGIPLSAPVALFLSRIAPEKRPLLFVEAALSLPPGWHAIVAGSDIQGLSRKFPVSPRLHVVPPVRNPGDLLAASDVFVLPSVTEAHPIALTEAWLAGVPTVYCNWPFAEQLMDDHLTDLGVVVPVSVDAPELARAIARAINPRNTAPDRAFRVAWEHYTASAMAARWERYLGVEPNDTYQNVGSSSASY